MDCYDRISYQKAWKRALAIKDDHRTDRFDEQVPGHPNLVQSDDRLGPSEHRDWIVLLHVTQRWFSDLDLGDDGPLTYLIAPGALNQHDQRSVWVDAQSC